MKLSVCIHGTSSLNHLEKQGVLVALRNVLFTDIPNIRGRYVWQCSHTTKQCFKCIRVNVLITHTIPIKNPMPKRDKNQK